MRWMAALLLGTVLSAATAARGSTPEEATLSIDPDPFDAHVYLRGSDPTAEPQVCTGRCTLHLRPGTFRIEAGMSHGSLGRAGDPLLLRGGDSQRIRVTVKENVPRLGGIFVCAVAGIGMLLVGAIQELTRPGPDPWETRAVGGNPWVIAGAISALAGGVIGAYMDPYDVEVRPTVIPVAEGAP